MEAAMSESSKVKDREQGDNWEHPEQVEADWTDDIAPGRHR
jgi:hypothetical protein